MTAAATDSTSTLLEAKRKDLLALDARKKALQSEAEAIISELNAEVPGGGDPMGIDTPLVDAEGYPRADIDVYRARTLRKRFKEIQTDHRALEKKVAAGLVEIAALSPSSGKGNSVSKTTEAEEEAEKLARLAPKPKPKFDPKTGKWVVKSWDGSVAGVEDGEARSFDDLGARSAAALASNLGGGGAAAGGSVSGGGAPNASNGNQQQPSARQRPQVSFTGPAIPFAIIDEVSPDSPASSAGLKENDLILKFGHVDSTNHAEFRAIAELVPKAAGENKSITVVVRRKTTELGGLAEVIKTEVVELRPRTWGGRGLLGCHIRPYSE